MGRSEGAPGHRIRSKGLTRQEVLESLYLCLGGGLLNNTLIEIPFMYHTIHSSKVYSSRGFHIVKELGNHRHINFRPFSSCPTETVYSLAVIPHLPSIP